MCSADTNPNVDWRLSYILAKLDHVSHFPARVSCACDKRMLSPLSPARQHLTRKQTVTEQQPGRWEIVHKCEYSLVRAVSSSENIKNPLFMSSVLRANIFDVTFCGFWRKSFAVTDNVAGARVFVKAGSGGSLKPKSTFSWMFWPVDAVVLAKIEAVTERGRAMISKLFTFTDSLGFMMICWPMIAGSCCFFFELSNRFWIGFKSLIPITRFAIFGSTTLSLALAPFIGVGTSADLARCSCWASSWVHDRISCSFSIPL